MDPVIIIPVIHVKLVVILVTILVTLVLDQLITNVYLVNYHSISIITNVFLHVQLITTWLILHNHTVLSVTPPV
jgi:hypothetical protein